MGILYPEAKKSVGPDPAKVKSDSEVAAIIIAELEREPDEINPSDPTEKSAFLTALSACDDASQAKQVLSEVLSEAASLRAINIAEQANEAAYDMSVSTRTKYLNAGTWKAATFAHYGVADFADLQDELTPNVE